MGAGALTAGVVLAIAVAAGGGYLFWRRVWFFRNPQRVPPDEPGLLSPADGTVVYVREVEPNEAVVVIKRGLRATVCDILREDVAEAKLVIGIFMSPFDVHYNRVPFDASIRFIRRHPSRGGNAHMGPMHWRTLRRREPLHENSVHIVQNERTVTLFEGEYRGAALSAYVVQIGARTVNGIDSYFPEGARAPRGAVFGMIRIGSQVDLVVPRRASFQALVRPGDVVRAGETILIV